MEGLSELIKNESNSPENIAEGYKYVGQIVGITDYFRTFIVLEQTSTEKYFLNIFNGMMGSIDPCYFIEFNNVDELRSIIQRYDQPKRAAGFGQGIGIVQMMAMRQLNTEQFALPNLVGDNEQGWYCIDDLAYGYCDIDKVSAIENDCVFFDGTHNAFIKQMTAFDASSPVTVIETAHSNGFVVFIHKDENALFTLFYFQGDSKQDVPVDMQACINRYGLMPVKHNED